MRWLIRSNHHPPEIHDLNIADDWQLLGTSTVQMLTSAKMAT